MDLAWKFFGIPRSGEIRYCRVGILEKCGLDYRKILVGQGYDGASVMSGQNTGVQTRIREVANIDSMYILVRII